MGDNCTRTTSILLLVLTYTQVSQLMGSLNWAPGRLYLRPLQRYFHLFGLTDLFTSPRRSDPLVLANLLRHWQDPGFLTSGIPIRTFQVDFTIFTDSSMQWWGARNRGFPDFGYLDPYRPLRKLHINCLELEAVIRALKHWAPLLKGPPGHDRYGQFDSRASPLVRGSEHHSPSKTYSRLSEHDTRPPISSESADTDRVVPSPRGRETYLQGLGDTRSRHVCNSVELPPSSVHVSISGAKSPSGGCSVSRLAGEVNVHVSPIPPAQQSHSEAPVHPVGRGNSHSPLMAVSVVVSTPTSSLFGSPSSLFLPSRSSVPAGSEVCLRWKVVPSACMEALMQHYKQQAFQTRSLGSPQPLRGPQPIACTTIGGFASLLGPQGKGLIRLIPQLS